MAPAGRDKIFPVSLSPSVERECCFLPPSPRANRISYTQIPFDGARDLIGSRFPLSQKSAHREVRDAVDENYDGERREREGREKRQIRKQGNFSLPSSRSLSLAVYLSLSRYI